MGYPFFRAFVPAAKASYRELMKRGGHADMATTISSHSSRATMMNSIHSLVSGYAFRRLGMPSRKFVWDPGHWRLRAEEARTVADQMTHEEARTIMRHIANDYDRLAKVAEEQLADQERGAIGDKT
jgi:hypothetical protein